MVAAELSAPPTLLQPRGEMQAFLRDLRSYKGERTVLQAVIEGPRGSAKSRNFTTFLFNCARHFAGMQILVVRKTRADLADTWCKTFETEVVPLDMRASVIGDAKATNRTEYTLPNGSAFVLLGLDRPSKHQGANVDVTLMEELEELTWGQVQGFLGALRKFTGSIPWQLFVGLTNPGPPKHWANLAAIRGDMRRVVTTHKDNPKWWDEDARAWTPEGKAYMASLSRYTGVQHKRHVLGLWAGAEGTVWENFDDKTHIIDAPTRPDGFPDYSRLGVKDYIASMDWGFTAPGCLSIFGRDSDKRLIRIAEVYRVKQSLEWWADRVVELDEEFGLSRIVCDPSRPDAIALLNDHLRLKGRPMLAEPANNKRASSTGGDLGGIDLVRWGFEKDESGMPRIRFLKNAHRFGPDQELIAEGQPTCTEEEIPGYTFARDAHGEVLDDRTDPDVPDHGADSLRYACAENWRKAPAPEVLVPKFVPGTLGHTLRHEDEYRRVRRHAR